MKDFVISYVAGEASGIVSAGNFAARSWLRDALRGKAVTRFNNSVVVPAADLLGLIAGMDASGLSASWKESSVSI